MYISENLSDGSQRSKGESFDLACCHGRVAINGLK